MPRNPNEKTYRHFCGTSFNPKDDDYFEKLRGRCRYYIFGKEHCPTTGNFHYQFYVYFRNALTEKAARQFFHPDHVEVCAGNTVQNQDYCKKDGNFIEWGLAPEQGKRKDLDECRHAAANGHISDVIDHGNLQQIKVAEKWLEYNAPKRDPKNPIKVIWISGASGSGKSRMAYEEFPNAYRKMPGKWWDGYNSEEVVIFDDFDPNDYTEKQLLTWWDRYPCRVEVKGGSRQLFATTFVITALFPPSSFWQDCEIGTQFLRRISEIREL